MAVWIGNRTEVRSSSSKIFVWTKRVLILGFVGCVFFGVRTYSEDTHSHAIKVSFPLLMGFSQVVYRPDDYDAAKAEWGTLHEAISVNDGQIIFVQTKQATFAVKFLKQTLEPEQTECEYVEVGGSGQIVKLTCSSFPGGIRLPNATVRWSGHEIGKGFIYLKNPFVPGKPSKFKIGVPFYSGDLSVFSKAVPTDVHFESLPSKVGEAPDGF